PLRPSPKPGIRRTCRPICGPASRTRCSGRQGGPAGSHGSCCSPWPHTLWPATDRIRARCRVSKVSLRWPGPASKDRGHRTLVSGVGGDRDRARLMILAEPEELVVGLRAHQCRQLGSVGAIDRLTANVGFGRPRAPPDEVVPTGSPPAPVV